ARIAERKDSPPSPSGANEDEAFLARLNRRLGTAYCSVGLFLFFLFFRLPVRGLRCLWAVRPSAAGLWTALTSGWGAGTVAVLAVVRAALVPPLFGWLRATHTPRLVGLAAPVAAGLACAVGAGTRSRRFRLAAAAGGVALGLTAWLLVPTTTGR